MLNDKELAELKEHLEKAQNPIFFFDNDDDGLASFLLLRRYIDRGRGVAIKSFPDLNTSYYRKVKELNPDYIFILDKPSVSLEFLNQAKADNIPIVWIDHHMVDKPEGEWVNYYNPYYTSKTNEPVSYICYKITNNKKDVWIAVIGCIFDRFIPDFYGKFRETYPELSADSKDAFRIFYESKIGKISRVLNFALKDRVSNVVNMLKFMMKVKTPYELADENDENHLVYRRFNQISPKYNKLLEKALACSKNSGKLLFFRFSGELSISADLANELIYRFPNKVVVVAYINGAKVNISVRGKKVRGKILEVIKNLEDATGGGHEEAVGVKIRSSDIEKFRDELAGLIKQES